MRSRDTRWFDEQYAQLSARGQSWGTPAMYQAKLACLQWCFECLALSSETRLLDLGCGAGELASLLEANGFAHVDGVDISPVAVARARAANSGQFQVLDFAAPCRLERRYECIFDTDCLHMVVEAERRQVFLANVVANLTEDGVFLTGVNSTQEGVEARVVVEEHVQYLWPTTEEFVAEVCAAGLRVVARRDLPPRNAARCARWSELAFQR